jgi:parallel beta-helix repeat protein
VATASKVSGTVIDGNHITGNHFGIFLEAARWKNGLFRAT